MTAATLKQCPACTQVTLGPHCDEDHAVTPCDWTLCNNPTCQAAFDWVTGRGHRLAPERTMVKTKKGTFPARVRMILDSHGDWRDDLRDGS